MSHTQFKANPWATIRMHAGNSLATKDVVDKKQKPKSAKRAVGTGTGAGMEVDV